jgi:UDP-N-acetylglucosamine acyltransferase
MDDIYESKENFISPHAFVDPNAIIGTGNFIGVGVIIRAGVQIGDNNFIGPYSIIGEAAEKVGYFEWNRLPGKVLIGSNNIITKQVTIDAGTDDVTIIKSNCILLKNSHLGHDAYLEDGVTLSCNAVIGGFTKVGKGTNFGIGAVAHQRLTIPESCMIGMNTTITKKTVLQPFRKYAGIPARDIGENKRT